MDESDIDQLEATLLTTKTTGRTYLRAALLKFLINWFFLAIFYLMLLYFFPCLKWLSFIFLPIILYSLYHIYQQNRLFRQKIVEIELLIKALKDD